MSKRFRTFTIALLLTCPTLATPGRGQFSPGDFGAPAGAATSAGAPAASPTVAPATTRPAPVVSTVDSQPIFAPGRTPTRTGPTAAATSRPVGSAAPSSMGRDIGRMFLSLGIVLALIGGLYWLIRRFYGGAAVASSTRVIKVLSRTTLAPRQQAMLLQVGRRVIVVGESNGQLSQLAQITDADEVAELLGQIQGEQMQRAASFGTVFRRNQQHFEEPTAADLHTSTEESADGTRGPAGDAATVPEDDVARQRSELSSLLEKVRSLKGQIDR